MGIAGSHIAFGFYDTAVEQRFLLIGKHTVAAVLHGLPAPPRAEFMQDFFVGFADGKTCARPVSKRVNFTFDPAHGVFRENRCSAHFAGLITDDQLVMFDPDSAFAQMFSQRQRAAYRQRFVSMLLINLRVMLCALGTYRWLDDVDQGFFMRPDTGGKGVQIQLGHFSYPLNCAQSPFSAAYCSANVSRSGSFNGWRGAR
ncbi:hypothetical protein SRABI106_04271 [Rahnella aquatilis]|nr:hypothetical protein SRABI106_04271 [Rahnella aquatilis]